MRVNERPDQARVADPYGATPARLGQHRFSSDCTAALPSSAYTSAIAAADAGRAAAEMRSKDLTCAAV